MYLDERKEAEREFSFKFFFVPLTTVKAIHWIIIIGLIVFFNALFGNFVLDDVAYITANPGFHSPSFWELIKGNLYNSGGQYRPIAALYFFTLYNFFGNTSFFYHLPQVIFHIINSILLFLVFNKFFSNPLSFILSIIFLSHPIQVESVSYIAATDNSLFFLFGITALLLSLNKKISLRRIIIIFSLLTLSLFSKETGFLFLFIIILSRILIYKNKICIFIISGCLITLVYFAIRFGFAGVYFTNLNGVPINNLPFGQKLINIPAIMFYYINTFFFPLTLAVNQNWIITKISFSSFYFPFFIDLVFFFLLGFIGWYIYKKDRKIFPTFLFFLFWFLSGLALNLQLIPLDMTVSDKWFYFPIAGLLGILGICLTFISRKNKKLDKALFFIGLLIVILLSTRTIVRNTNWSDAVTLYTHDVKIRDNGQLENYLGDIYFNQHDYQKALNSYKKAMELEPTMGVLYNIAGTYLTVNDIPDAELYYLKTISWNGPVNVNEDIIKEYSYLDLGNLFLRFGSVADALKITKGGLTHYPKDGLLWEEYAISLYRMDNYKEALAAISKAKILHPNIQIETLYRLIKAKKSLNSKTESVAFN